MRGRWRWLWGSVLATILLGGWIAWRARQPEFQFLAGRKPLGPIDEGPQWDDHYVGFPPQRRSEVLYGFQEKFEDVVKSADKQLLPSGWVRDTYTDTAYTEKEKPLDVQGVVYREPSGLERTISIQQDCSVPSRGTSDLIIVGEYRRGWTGVAIAWPNKNTDWQTRAKMWFGKVFLGRP